MHYFIPYFDAVSTGNALREACRTVLPGDRVTVTVPVVVPGDLPVDVGASAIWKRVCEAERRSLHARADAERILPPTVDIHVVRVQARDRASAILAGAAHYEADLILLPMREGLRGALTLRFGTIAEVLRYATCDLRFVGMAEGRPRQEQVAARRDAADGSLRPARLRVVADNPVAAGAARDGVVRRTEEQHA